MSGPTSLSGRPMHSLSDRSLRRYECAWCNQRLDRAKKGYCGALPWSPHRHTDTRIQEECAWPEILRAPAIPTHGDPE